MRDPGTVCYNVDEKTRYKVPGRETWLRYVPAFRGPTEQTVYVRHFGKVNGCIKQTISYPSMLNITT